MEEVEGLTENSEEHIHHAAHSGPQWASWVALSTAILATLAAISALLSGSNANEAMLQQLEASDQWGYYQAKGIKGAVAETYSGLLVAAGKPADPKLDEKVARYREEQEKISEGAKELQTESRASFGRHEIFSKSVTLFQVSIAVSAISVLTKRQRYWFVSLVFGAGGLIFLFLGLAKQFGPALGGHGGH